METSRRSFLKAGAVAALVLAAGGGIYRAAHAPRSTPRSTPFALDGEARAALEAIVAALLAGALPAAQAGRSQALAAAIEGKRGVVDPEGRYRGVRNLSVHDGSLFPTSIGANPQLSIYGIAARLASGLAKSLTGRPAPRVEA